MKEDAMGRACSTWKIREMHTNFRYRRRRKGNIRTDLRKIGWEVMDWIQLAHDRSQWQAIVDMVTKLQFPQNVGTFLTSW